MRTGWLGALNKFNNEFNHSFLYPKSKTWKETVNKWNGKKIPRSRWSFFLFLLQCQKKPKTWLYLIETIFTTQHFNSIKIMWKEIMIYNFHSYLRDLRGCFSSSSSVHQYNYCYNKQAKITPCWFADESGNQKDGATNND